MCTAITYKGADSYFGRTLDLFCSYGERVTITPRNYKFPFLKDCRHYAIIGMAQVRENFPLYYDGANEWGLAMAGLNFPKSTKYEEPVAGKINIGSFELIPYILATCKNVSEARVCLGGLCVTDKSFSPELPPSPLHYIISDKNESITVEFVAGEKRIYDNPYGVMTNEPEFPFMEKQLAAYRHLSPASGECSFSPLWQLPEYSAGMGAIGLPGDLSSPSRFVRAAFMKGNSPGLTTERESVEHFFTLLDTVKMPKGAVLTPSGEPDYTVYTSCINLDKGIYYYNTYNNRAITECRLPSAEGEGIMQYNRTE